MATNQTKGRDRNQPCGCGSGLKAKNCHGDPTLQHTAMNTAKGIVQLFVIQRMHESDKIDADETVKAVNNIVAQINKLLPECVELKTCFSEEEEKPKEPVVDKLEQKEKEGGTLDDLQQGTYLCGCGQRLPQGMECAKCKKGR